MFGGVTGMWLTGKVKWEGVGWREGECVRVSGCGWVSTCHPQNTNVKQGHGHTSRWKL